MNASRLATAATAVALVVAGVGFTLHAQRGAAPADRPAPAGRGAAEQNPLGQPLMDPAGFIRDEAMLPAPPLAPEDRKYADLDGKRMKQFVMEVDAISLKDRDSGNVFWGRNVGTAGHVATQDWVEKYFRASNLKDIHRLPFDLAPQWTPKAWD